MLDHPRTRSILLAGFLVIGIASIAVAERICEHYDFSRPMTDERGNVFCGGWGFGCTECYDPDTGGSCQTSLETCEPGNDIDIRN